MRIFPEDGGMAKTIVITGASSGFGKGIVRALVTQGHNLVIAARREELIGELADEIRHVVAVPTDVAKIDDVEHVRDRALADFGQIDVWINNAGVGEIGPFADSPLEDKLGVVDTNLVGAVNGSHIALGHFRERRRGTLINVVSIAGKVAMPYFGIYGATRSAVISLSASIRRELALAGQDDIHVCTVKPWVSDIPVFGQATTSQDHSLRMPALDDDDGVVDAILGLVEKPRNEVDVDVRPKTIVLGSHVTPGLTEPVSARNTFRFLIDAPNPDGPAPSVYPRRVAATPVPGKSTKRPRVEGRPAV
jgi:short-subunit dehydrogenase